VPSDKFTLIGLYTFIIHYPTSNQFELGPGSGLKSRPVYNSNRKSWAKITFRLC